jgi:hypothetical protein
LFFFSVGLSFYNDNKIFKEEDDTINYEKNIDNNDNEINPLKNKYRIYFFILFYLPSDQFFFSEPATEVMSKLIEFHNDVMFYVCFISAIVFGLLFAVIYNFVHNLSGSNEFNINFGNASRINHNMILEII